MSLTAGSVEGSMSRMDGQEAGWIYRYIGSEVWSFVPGKWPDKWGYEQWERKPLYLHPDPSDREGMVEALRRIVAAYNREVLIRTADVHSAGCECLRCAIDNAEDALRKMGAGR
jgi:hypothetical protein